MASASPHTAARDIFGSDSDEDSDAFPRQPADQPEQVDADEVQEASGDHSEQQVHRQAEGDDSEAYEEPYAERDQAGYSQQPDEPRGPPLDLLSPLVPNPAASRLRYFKASNVLGIDTRPYDPQLLLDEALEDKQGVLHVEPRNLNTIRWRWALQEDGSMAAESNARWIRWEDGSVQLFVGSEVLNASDTDITSNHQHLYIRHKDLIQGQAVLDQRLTVQPASLSSAFHKRLTANADRKHAKQLRVRHTATVANPLKERAEREKREEDRIRSRQVLERKQNKAMRGYSQPQRAPAGGHALTTNYLEADMDEGEFEEDGEDGFDADARGSLSRGRYDDQVEREREERLARAKRSTPGASEQRRPPSKSRDADMDGFIVEEDDEEDDVKPKAKRSRRAVVLSDSEDDE